MSQDLQPANEVSAATNAHRSKLLFEATRQFCLKRHEPTAEDIDTYTKLFYSLIGETNATTKKSIASHLARNRLTPRTIAYYFAMEPIGIAAPFLLISDVFWERDLLQLVTKIEPSHLAMLARRSDLTPAVAQALSDRGDTITSRILATNPVLKLNTLAQKAKADTAGVKQAEKTLEFLNKSTDQQLLELANVGGRLKRSSQHTDRPQEQDEQPTALAKRLELFAKSKDFSLFSGEIAAQIDMPFEKVHKIVSHESGASLAIFLKGLHLSRSQTSQLLLLVNKRVGQNIAEYTSSMALYDKFSLTQCQDIMRTSGARKMVAGVEIKATTPDSTDLEKAALARRQQILASQPSALFGEQRKAS